jgi:DNA segregation ATPase FtsK/SpoIIIE-like protein
MNNTATYRSFAEMKKKFKPAQKQESLPQPNRFGEDGVDHINLNIHAKTFIGKTLSIEASGGFYYPYLGRFNSVNAFWVWLHDYGFNDSIRRMSRRRISEYKKSTKLNTSYIHNFQAMIAYATWLKVHNNKRFIEEVKKSDDLPLLCYYVVPSSGVRVQFNFAPWFVRIAKEIITAIKEDREPNFELFVTDPEYSDFFYTKAVLMSLKTRPGLSKEDIEAELQKLKEKEAEEVNRSKEAVKVEEDEQPVQAAQPATEQSAQAAQPVTEEPQVAQPATEQPVQAAQPATEQPAQAAQPVSEESQVAQPATEQPAQAVQPTTEEPQVAQPATEQSAQASQPVTEESQAAQPATEEPQVAQAQNEVPQEAVNAFNSQPTSAQ